MKLAGTYDPFIGKRKNKTIGDCSLNSYLYFNLSEYTQNTKRPNLLSLDFRLKLDWLVHGIGHLDLVPHFEWQAM